MTGCADAVDALGSFELVFEDDDPAPACGFDRGALVDEFTRAGVEWV
ncbi:hypothetical protein [Streptomyces sp. NPDC050534]